MPNQDAGTTVDRGATQLLQGPPFITNYSRYETNRDVYEDQNPNHRCKSFVRNHSSITRCVGEETGRPLAPGGG
ncbi:hypothetical protein CEP52_009692 [Fusarium oligoseptatum]|uniref:Uncharacterized protein n=1 Tax=Fusarium oligoseptatum TaxID=2604345 RepID=A0A428TBU6_9HYPO|nr:hypothetical protein CEP52_009692 [Fusarium oligoseptatum]